MEDEDRDAVLELLSTALGWEHDPRFAELFDWKHRRNSFGPSLAWVAVIGGSIVGYRAFLRWEFSRGDGVAHAVRAVDTATSPTHRRHGIFEALTTHALEAVRPAGTAFVFNTPNAQSRPGYLKMGWKEVGGVPVSASVRGIAGWPRLLTARAPAARWPEPTEGGLPGAVAFVDDGAVRELIEALPSSAGLRTRITPEYLRWRYGLPIHGYRVLTAPEGLAAGCAIFRVRRRGRAREAMVCDVLAPAQARHVRRGLEREVLRVSDADYFVRAATAQYRGDLGVRVPGQGPVLTWRGVNDDVGPPIEEWDLSLGDVELF